MNRWLVLFVLPCLLAALWAGACGHTHPRDWNEAGRPFDLLRRPRPPAEHSVGGVQISDVEYRTIVRLGEEFFRGETLGNERTNTDIAGLMQGMLDVPCEQPAAPGCTRQESVLTYLVRAIDRLDGVDNNLFAGNGGPQGTGYTHDLVIDFPRGTRLLGVDVPEHLHTGLDVEAGSAWPIGIVPVAAPAADASLPYLIDPQALGVGPVDKPGKVRIGISCALCHYSLDVDWDGKTDLHSAWSDQPTPGSPYRPQDAWAIGNQDLHVGWLFALTANPMLGFAVLSGPIGVHDLKQSERWVKWVRDNYERSPLEVKKEVVRGMITQPRGYADISPNALYDNVQFPMLFTRHGWPYNYDGSLVSASDRNSSVWTTALDFTGLIGLSKDRSAAGELPLYWETTNIYNVLDAERLADIWVVDSPAVRHDPTLRKTIRDDILGLSDGAPGLLRTDSIVVVDDAPPGMVPPAVMAKAESACLVRSPKDFGGDAELRGPTTALVGIRIRTPPAVLQRTSVSEILARHKELRPEEFMNNAVSLMLDALNPPKSQSKLIEDAQPLWAKGYEVFKDNHCDTCHRGPFLTDNMIHRISLGRRQETGLPETPSTAGWRIEGRGRGPAIATQPDRMLNSRVLQLYAAPNFDPVRGVATSKGSPLQGLFGDKTAGYKTAPLRYLWGSAPFLHDGGVGIGLRPEAGQAGDDLRTLLRRPEADKLYGMGAVTARRELQPSESLRADAALSLQALVLKGERERVIEGNREQVVPVNKSDATTDALGHPRAEWISMQSLGVTGEGHEFFIDDVPGGDKVTALVAFLLALDHLPIAEQKP